MQVLVPSRKKRGEATHYKPNLRLHVLRLVYVCYVLSHLGQIYQLLPGYHIVCMSWCIRPGSVPGSEGGRNTEFEWLTFTRPHTIAFLEAKVKERPKYTRGLRKAVAPER